VDILARIKELVKNDYIFFTNKAKSEMSLSPRNGQQIEKGRRIIPPASGWRCPECGQKALIRVKKSYQLEEGIAMPSLEWVQCQSCKEDFFDSHAMYAIEEFRKRQPLKKSLAQRTKRAVAA